MAVTGPFIAAGIIGTVGGYAITSALSKDAPPLPPVQPPPVMPTMNDSAVQAAKRRSLQAQALRHGRASTILTDPLGETDKLG